MRLVPARLAKLSSDKLDQYLKGDHLITAGILRHLGTVPSIDYYTAITLVDLASKNHIQFFSWCRSSVSFKPE